MDSLTEWIGGGTVGALLLVVMSWALGRRKTKADVEGIKADAAETLVDVALKLREAAAEDLKLIKDELGDTRGLLETAQEQLETAQEQLDDHIAADIRGKERRARSYEEHQRWDTDLAKRLRDFGVDVDDPPPLHEEG